MAVVSALSLAVIIVTETFKKYRQAKETQPEDYEMTIDKRLKDAMTANPFGERQPLPIAKLYSTRAFFGTLTFVNAVIVAYYVAESIFWGGVALTRNVFLHDHILWLAAFGSMTVYLSYRFSKEYKRQRIVFCIIESVCFYIRDNLDDSELPDGIAPLDMYQFMCALLDRYASGISEEEMRRELIGADEQVHYSVQGQKIMGVILRDFIAPGKGPSNYFQLTEAGVQMLRVLLNLAERDNIHAEKV